MGPSESHPAAGRISSASREALLGVLWASRVPLDTAAIAGELGLHANGVRRRLWQLRELGLVERERIQVGVGRPRDRWRIAPRAYAEIERSHTGWLIARSLAGAIASGGPDPRELESAGEELGHQLIARWGARPGSDPLVFIDRALEALGFTADRTIDDTTVCYRLTTCPYAELVRVNPTAVCTLHKGVMRSLLAAAEPEAVLTAFEPGDPKREGCLVQARLPPRAPGDDGTLQT